MRFQITMAYFKKRTCICYVANEDTQLCVGCQKEKFNGIHEPNRIESIWNYETCTKKEQTDACGKLSFPASHSKNAEVTDFLIIFLKF